MKVAFMFSGQGAQYAGMGKEIAENFESAKNVFAQADAALGFEISKICFDEENKLLNETEYTQPAILTTSTAIMTVLEEKNIKPEAVLGLSLGEYSALVASNVISFVDCVKLVNKRGKFMTEAVPSGEGSMAAILGLEKEKLQAVCDELSKDGILEIANYNCPGQLVIGGETALVKAALEKTVEAGAKRAIELNVSGPFHTSMLKPAAVKLREELDKVEFNSPSLPVVMNVNAEKLTDNVVELLEKQVMSSVMFEDSIRTLMADGYDTFIEVGPGKTLTSFVKKIDKSLTILNVQDMKSLEKTLEKLEV